MNKELLLGCGYRRDKMLGIGKSWQHLITLDKNPECEPDVLHDLTHYPLPFKDEEFDEIHAYQVLEHLYPQGDYVSFFKEFSEYWRILKPLGLFCATVPLWNTKWVWGDPSHQRVIHSTTLSFLTNDKDELGKTSKSDFGAYWDKNFRLVFSEEKDETYYFILQKV